MQPNPTPDRRSFLKFMCAGTVAAAKAAAGMPKGKIGNMEMAG